MAYQNSRRIYMETTKNKQIVALVLGVLSLVLPNITYAIPSTDNTNATVGAAIAIILINLAALICGIVGIVKSAGARKEAIAAGEQKTLATVGLITSIVGTVYGAILFFVIGVCTCSIVACGAALASAASSM